MACPTDSGDRDRAPSAGAEQGESADNHTLFRVARSVRTRAGLRRSARRSFDGSVSVHDSDGETRSVMGSGLGNGAPRELWVRGPDWRCRANRATRASVGSDSRDFAADLRRIRKWSAWEGRSD